MADYIAQPDSAVDPDAPVTSDLMYALRDNPIAIAEGAAGAPRIQDAALSSTVTPTGRNWVAVRSVGASHNDIGQVMLARYTGSVTVSTGGTVSGSLLVPVNAAGVGSANTLTGNWRLQGFISVPADSPPPQQLTSLWIRVG